MSELPDVQNRKDHRNIGLERVGITNAKFPTSVLRKDGTISQVSATVKLFANLPEEAKGHNLSRFMETLVDFSETHKTLSSNTMPLLLQSMQDRLGSQDVYARFEFDYYIDKEAPVSKKVAPQGYVCAFTGIKKNGTYSFILEVNVVAASLCPCSKEMSLIENSYPSNPVFEEFVSRISPVVRINGSKQNSGDSGLFDISPISFKKLYGMGAHNQRSLIKVELHLDSILWIEDVIKLIEEQASAPTYPLLKRPDERFVTELAYKNPKFSEDIARDVQIAIEKQKEVDAWSLKVNNEESIHSYNVSVSSKSDNWNFH